MRFLKVFLTILAVLAGIIVIYGSSVMYLHREALAEADRFCNAVEIGSAATTLAERAKASGTRMVSGSNANLQRFVFPNPLNKDFSCDVVVEDGKVVSRKVDGMKD